MSVPVTKRVAKMKLGDLYPKKEKKTGWWAQIDMSENYWLDFHMRERLYVATGHRPQYLDLSHQIIGKVVAAYKPTWRGVRVGFRDHFKVFPTYSTLSPEVKNTVDEVTYNSVIGVEYMTDAVFVGGRFVIPIKRSHILKYPLGEKYVRTDTWPSWLFDVVMEMEPLV
jgi:hypothetical protein